MQARLAKARLLAAVASARPQEDDLDMAEWDDNEGK